jgi:hypothetical protein
VNGNADEPRFVHDAALDTLFDPPERVSRKLVAALVLELLHGAQEP